jgi:hypothetical protein
MSINLVCNLHQYVLFAWDQFTVTINHVYQGLSEIVEQVFSSIGRVFLFAQDECCSMSSMGWSICPKFKNSTSEKIKSVSSEIELQSPIQPLNLSKIAANLDKLEQIILCEDCILNSSSGLVRQNAVRGSEDELNFLSDGKLERQRAAGHVNEELFHFLDEEGFFEGDLPPSDENFESANPPLVLDLLQFLGDPNELKRADETLERESQEVLRQFESDREGGIRRLVGSLKGSMKNLYDKLSK